MEHPPQRSPFSNPAREDSTACSTPIPAAPPLGARATLGRTEFGYTRTCCACASCILNCRHIPGYLLPQDVERIACHLGYTNPALFACDHLLASPGATVMNSETGRTFQIPTLVPRRGEDGACVFLDDGNRCRIHAVSPYGCAFFDCRQTDEEANRRSARGLQEVARQWAAPGRNLYTVVWGLLYCAGLLAIPPAEARARMAAAAREEDRAESKG